QQAQAVAFVREFAHQARPDRKPNDRIDFTETLYWSAGLRTDAKTGEATVRFHLADSVTSFKAMAGGYTGDGALGSGETRVDSVQPFYLEPKLPLEVSGGDVVQVPLAVVNGTDASLGQARVRLQTSPVLRHGELASLSLRGGDRARALVALQVGRGNGPAKIAFEGTAGNYQDRVERSIWVKPSGFPFEIAFGGMVGPGKPVARTLSIPEGVVEGSVTFQGSIFPTPLANMTQALSRLIQEPSGCFEQTSSTTYPMTMAQQYFLTHTGVDPQLIQSARQKLDSGYQRLVGFECSEKGYEWFGENPGHEALTAFGLMHFTDMSKVRPVDQAMLATTRAWLLKQRDGSGGFERKRRALHTWIEDKDSSNAYITWALLESGERNGSLSREVQTVQAAGEKSPNAYVTALAANVDFLGGKKDEARAAMQKLASKQAADGSVQGATQSIVGSGGEALLVETTALATLAWLRDPQFSANVEKSIRYLAEVCQGGRYGSTQSTVLALRAIVAYDQARAHPKRSGTVRLVVDGKPVGSPVRFDADTKGAIALPDAAPALTSGAHKLELLMDDGAEMPYSVDVRFHATTPDSSRKAKVGLEIGASRPQVTEGELVDVVATVTNRTQEQLPTVTAIIGLPGGLEPRHDQLKELVKKGAVDAYEVKGRDVVLYWRGMEPGASNRVPLSLVAAVPGSYTGPASRAYLYYTDEDKVWVKGLAVTVAPKK
ncbi:MAG TPA: alpha-2-macroglobulin family protein, partial [Myxococcales bacterium]|nr:alpha-2-macroglobulin family protein [Myxococcales bacterium]